MLIRLRMDNKAYILKVTHRYELDFEKFEHGFKRCVILLFKPLANTPSSLTYPL